MKTLLTAYWTNLLTATFETDKSFLQKYLPAKTELNEWNGKYFMSIVAFMFEKPVIAGLPSPFYRSFEEINLRFYVMYKEKNEWRKGVVFIKEIAPHYIIGQAAKWLYKENFISLPMNHNFSDDKNLRHTNYFCRDNSKWNYLSMESAFTSFEPKEESIESFVRDRYWGYTKTSGNETKEFRIEHQPWKIFPATKFDMTLDIGSIYGEEFKEYLTAKPISTFLMDGSYTKVSWPVKL
jgi:uncharacterized protein YqjF (DUF2071 family)